MEALINSFGEFKSRTEERDYLQTSWPKDRTYTLLSYLVCCILLLFAGILADYQRAYTFGSPNILTFFRSLLVAYGLGFFVAFRKSDYSDKIETHLFFIKLVSVVIVALMTFMIMGTSTTLLAGIMIMTTSFYVMLPGRLNGIIVNCALLFALFMIIPILNESVDLNKHFYKIFILLSLNIVLFAFRSMFNRAWRLFYISNRRLEELNKTKDDVISTIAHDLKSPLQVILSSASLVSKRNEELSVERIKLYQDRIIKSAKKTDALLKDLLAWALTSNESLGYTPKELNIKDTITSAVEFAYELAQTKDLEIEVDLEDYIFNHDSNMIETCVRNIISNAIKFSPEGKKIVVKGAISDGYAIQICDEGEGVPDIVIDGIQSGQTFHVKQGTKGEKGTGIGLKLVHSFLKKHGAALFIENMPNCGSRVTLKFPMI
ncbi:HAMP domain-containing sensor histidine kinase [Halobacteriovorax sp. ZH4_bin.1]|uniref:sensor histidine kinase n=1 Tax=unclassified Halobacteriovorax TaxID=2639665 RepID=UPI0037222306